MLLHRRAVRDIDWTHYVGQVVTVQKVSNAKGQGMGGIVTAFLELVLELDSQTGLWFRGYPDMHMDLPTAGYVMMRLQG